MYSPSTFAKEDVKETSANVIAEIDVINSLTILLIIIAIYVAATQNF